MQAKRFTKPNMNNLKGKKGRAVLAEIRSMKAPSTEAIRREPLLMKLMQQSDFEKETEQRENGHDIIIKKPKQKKMLKQFGKK